MKAQLSLSDEPELDKPVQLTAIIDSSEIKNIGDVVTDVRVQIILPSGLKLVEGELEWHGDISREKPVGIRATIKAVTTGYWVIEARISYSPPYYPDVYMRSTDYLVPP